MSRRPERPTPASRAANAASDKAAASERSRALQARADKPAAAKSSSPRGAKVSAKVSERGVPPKNGERGFLSDKPPTRSPSARSTTESVGGKRPGPNPAANMVEKVPSPRPQAVVHAAVVAAPVKSPRPPRVAKAPVERIETPGGALWLWGRHAVEAALANPERTVIRLLITPEAQASFDAHEGELPKVELAGTVLPEVVDRAVIDALLGATTVHQGLALLVKPLPDVGVEDLIRLAEGRPTAVIVVLDQVTDPHNVGAVLRTAAAFGAVGLLVQDRHTPDESGALAKAASGALERVTVARVSNLVRALDTLRESGFWVAGLAADGAGTLASAKLSGKVVLALGSEGQGLRRLTREHCDLVVRLPMAPDGMESLNVSVAAAIALYEVAREGLE